MAERQEGDRPAVVVGLRGGEESVYRDRARRLGLPFAQLVHLGRDAISEPAAIRRGTLAMSRTAEQEIYIAPAEDAMPGFMRALNANPAARRRVRVSTPTAIRAALRQAAAHRYLGGAMRRLETTAPGLSARTGTTRGQAAFGIALIAALATAAISFPRAALAGVEVTAALFFSGVVVLRLLAAGLIPRRLPAPRHIDPRGGDLPVYTVLVALRHEAHMIAQLVAGLDRIAWPREKLDVKLVVDEDDVETIAAARALANGPPYEVIVVPAGGPRTKPMALQYALAFARGTYVTVYDAEDRPHPGQLAEAYATFRRSSPRLACLQAPLLIAGPHRTMLERLFAIEYAALFDGLLPALVRLRLPLPLGGSSNHFRLSALVRAGGWDPWNVTEDADLGIRLVRFGYVTGTITLPTAEDAPASLASWMRQRARWFKGWLQTWIVHMRAPARLLGALGGRRFIGFNMIGFGVIVSTIAHPLFLATLIVVLARGSFWSGGELMPAALFGLSLFNLVAGYAAMAVLAGRALALRGRYGLLGVCSSCRSIGC
jgi:cellulose synthase/poly-beta-1,6-N-acetylglucosamine synthase-like glycosyltransferase